MMLKFPSKRKCGKRGLLYLWSSSCRIQLVDVRWGKPQQLNCNSKYVSLDTWYWLNYVARYVDSEWVKCSFIPPDVGDFNYKTIKIWFVITTDFKKKNGWRPRKPSGRNSIKNWRTNIKIYREDQCSCCFLFTKPKTNLLAKWFLSDWVDIKHWNIFNLKCLEQKTKTAENTEDTVITEINNHNKKHQKKLKNFLNFILTYY